MVIAKYRPQCEFSTAWYRAVTGRDARESYDRERRRMTDRERAIDEWERDQDARDQV